MYNKVSGPSFALLTEKGLTCGLYLAMDSLEVALQREGSVKVAEAVLAHCVGFPITPLELHFHMVLHVVHQPARK